MARARAVSQRDNTTLLVGGPGFHPCSADTAKNPLQWPGSHNTNHIVKRWVNQWALDQYTFLQVFLLNPQTWGAWGEQRWGSVSGPTCQHRLGRASVSLHSDLSYDPHYHLPSSLLCRYSDLTSPPWHSHTPAHPGLNWSCHLSTHPFLVQTYQQIHMRLAECRSLTCPCSQRAILLEAPPFPKCHPNAHRNLRPRAPPPFQGPAGLSTPTKVSYPYPGKGSN